MGGEDDDDEEEERIAALNEELLVACESNSTDEVIRLIEEGADPCHEDQRHWSPLIWASSFGNEALARFLLKRGAAEVYRYDDSKGKARRKKHSPLHWAAFKGHHKILWLLMAPPHGLCHHEKDAIGNTALHQAAAGGSLECTKCLMAQGVDVFAKNDRGHTPFALCTAPEVQNLLQKAMREAACKATGKQFSSTVLRYMCSWSLDVFCEAAVCQSMAYESPTSMEKEKPVTWCMEVKNAVQDAEQHLMQALQMNHLDGITAALALAEDKPVDCKLLHQCFQTQAKLESDIELGRAMEVQTIEKLEEIGPIQDALTKAIEDAEWKNAESALLLHLVTQNAEADQYSQARIAAAKTLRRKLMAEASLMRCMEGPQKTTVGHITMLEELTSAAKGEHAKEELLAQATKLIAKLKSEREVQHRIAETAPLCSGDQENFPAWCHDTERFSKFHEEYKEVVEVAGRDEISSSLMATALEQLASIEVILIQKKQVEAEQQLKDSKKKKGKK